MTTNNPPSPRSTWVTIRALCWLFSPRKLRVYAALLLTLVTLYAVFVAVANWRGGRAWATARAALEAAGEPVELAALVPPPLPDQDNFALTPLLAPLFDFLPGTQTYRDTNAVGRLQSLRPPIEAREPTWPTRRFTDFQAWARDNAIDTHTNDPVACAQAMLRALDIHAAALLELRQAAERPGSRFNLKYDAEDPASILLPHLAVLRRFAQILNLRASAALWLGQTDAALADVELAGRLADTLRTEPLLISQLVRWACLRQLADPIYLGLARRQWTEPQLARLQALLGRYDLWSDGLQAMRGERAFGNAIIARVRAHPAHLRDLGIERSGATSELPMDILSCIGQFLVPRGWFYQEQVEYNRLFGELGLAPSQVAEHCLDPAATRAQMARLDEQLGGSAWHNLRTHRVLAQVLLPALGAVQQKLALTEAARVLAQVGIALERHRLATGEFPESLTALEGRWLPKLPHDPVRGEPLHYRRLPEGGFTLYSTGWNGADDGGTPGTTKRAWNAQEGDWVWQYPAPPNPARLSP